MLFPTICIDNFLDNPNQLVELSKQYDYFNEGYIFGERTLSLNNLNSDLFVWINKKMLSVIYPQDYMNISFSAQTCFQKSYSSELDGWVHVDSPNSMITAILFLTEEGTSGTSLYKAKSIFYNLDQSKKYEYFKNQSKKDYTEVLEAKQFNNKKFTKTLHFDGLFNRLVMFDSTNPHAAEVLKENQNRLILISFFEQMGSNNMKYPIPTMKGI